MAGLDDIFGLSGHRAIVTGASSGLGVEFAEALAIAGADVALVARRQERLQEVARRLEALAIEWGVRGITVNTIAPGFFPTELDAEDFDNSAIRERVETFTPLGRLGRAGELTAALLFLGSPAASYVTGSTVFVDGGYTAW